MMTYEEAKHMIDDGDVIFLKTNTLAGKIIRFFTSSPYTHVAIAFKMRTEPERLLVVEAQGGTKRRIINLSEYTVHEMDVIKSPKDWSTYSQQALDKLGVAKYGWTQAAYLGIRQFLLQKFRIKIPRRSIAGEICSEFVATCLGLSETRLTPSELQQALASMGHPVCFTIYKS